MSREFVALDIPVWITWGQRHGAFVDYPALRAQFPSIEKPAKPCGWCGSACQRPRRVWCSDGCSSKFSRIWSWGAVSSYVRNRDGGVCQRCKGDPKHTGMGQVDHILPVKDGGTDDPENLRLLCHDCHIAVGYEQRAARKARVTPQLEFAQSVSSDLERARG